jgi:hypothetical protein
MLKKVLFIGGEQDDCYNLVRRTRKRVEIRVYRQIDLAAFTGITTIDTSPFMISFLLPKSARLSIREIWRSAISVKF